MATYYSLDTSFAVSSGANVNDGPGTSTFDYPPNATSNLVISSNTGDIDPNNFEVGDQYDLSWDGMGGGGTIQDATVVRSDFIDYDGDQGYAVVLEGLDSGGDLVQVVWSPQFDLETWYWNNFDAGNSPVFYTSDQDALTHFAAVCFAKEALIDTPEGPRAAHTLRPGDRVLTADGGAQEVIWAGTRQVPGAGNGAPVTIPPGVMGNARALRLSQQHRVLIRDARAELLFGAEEVLVPAKALVALPGVYIRAVETISYVHLLLSDHHILSAEGVACESLYLAPDESPQMRDEALRFFPELATLIWRWRAARTCRPVLRVYEAELLLGMMTGQGAGPRKAVLSAPRAA